MAVRPDDLTIGQENFIIDFYKAQPQNTLDNKIKQDLKDFEKDQTDVDALDVLIATEKQEIENLIAARKKKVERLERKLKIKAAGVENFRDRIVDRHFELNGAVPPLNPNLI